MGGGDVDADIELALKNMEDKIISAVKQIVDERNQQLEKYITDLNGTKFKAVEKDIERHDKYHDEHFAEIKTIDERITKSRESIIKDLLEKNKFNISTVISIIAVIAAVLAVIIPMMLK